MLQDSEPTVEAACPCLAARSLPCGQWVTPADFWEEGVDFMVDSEELSVEEVDHMGCALHLITGLT